VPRAALEASLEHAAIGAVPLERFDWADIDERPGEWVRDRRRERPCERLVVGLGNVESLDLPGTLERLERAVLEASPPSAS